MGKAILDIEITSLKVALRWVFWICIVGNGFSMFVSFWISGLVIMLLLLLLLGIFVSLIGTTRYSGFELLLHLQGG
jgi:hypothetical protein